MDYIEFLESKKTIVQPAGFEVDPESINKILFSFQRDIVRWTFENDNAGNALQISPGMSDYVLRQIIYYAIDCIKGDQL